MSRRRPARNHHLERTEEVAAQVQEHVESAGPCPGSCNAVWRRRVAEHTEQLLEEHSDWPRHAAEDLAARDVSEKLVPRRGRPVWCHRHRTEIAQALEELPGLVERLLAVAQDVTPRRPRPHESGGSDGRRVDEPVQAVGWWTRGGVTIETLACGHRTTRTAAPVGPLVGERVCTTCVASGITAEPGRLAPPPKKARSTSGRAPVSPAVSPAGSPAWVEADAVIEWATQAAAECWPDVHPGQRMTVEHDRHSTEQERLSAMRTALRFLHNHLDSLLVPHGTDITVAAELGRQALQLHRRIERVGGFDLLVHRMPAACPRCDRRALERKDGGAIVRCAACGSSWDEDHYRHLARTQAWETQHPEMKEPTDA